MSERYLLHKPSGVVYIYQGVFAKNPDFVECADAQGTPLTPAIDAEFTVVDEPAAPKKTRAKKVGLKTAEPITETPVDLADDLPDIDELLGLEASKGL